MQLGSKKRNGKLQRELTSLEQVKVKIMREIDIANNKVRNLIEHERHEDAILTNAEALAYMACLLMVEEEIANARKL